MAYSRWSNSLWYVWVEYDRLTRLDRLMVWHVIDAAAVPPLPAQEFYPAEARKLAARGDLAAVRRAGGSEAALLEWIRQFVAEYDRPRAKE